MIVLKNINSAHGSVSKLSFISTGMDYKQIAMFPNIRAESVKQARWRLRVKMGLHPRESLENVLRGI